MDVLTTQGHITLISILQSVTSVVCAVELLSSKERDWKFILKSEPDDELGGLYYTCSATVIYV